jgi:hypothetical protein
MGPQKAYQTADMATGYLIFSSEDLGPLALCPILSEGLPNQNYKELFIK